MNWSTRICFRSIFKIRYVLGVAILTLCLVTMGSRPAPVSIMFEGHTIAVQVCSAVVRALLGGRNDDGLVVQLISPVAGITILSVYIVIVNRERRRWFKISHILAITTRTLRLHAV